MLHPYDAWRASIPAHVKHIPGLLERKNPHLRDQYIVFDEEPHIYYIYGIPKNISVTTLVKKGFPHFDAGAVIPGLLMKTDGKYVGMTAQQITEKWHRDGRRAAELGTLMHAAIEAFYNGEDLPSPRDKIDLSPAVTRFDDSPVPPIPLIPAITLPAPVSSTAALEASMTPYGLIVIPVIQELKHPSCRYVEENAIPLAHFRKFHDEIARAWVPLRTEWRIFDPSYGIVGTIDIVFIPNVAKSEEVIICDWKRSRKINLTNNFRHNNKGIIPATAAMDNCNYSEYIVQLNIYKWLLERNYQKKVIKMYIVVFHPDYASYQLFPIPDKQDIVRELMAWHLNTSVVSAS